MVTFRERLFDRKIESGWSKPSSKASKYSKNPKEFSIAEEKIDEETLEKIFRFHPLVKRSVKLRRSFTVGKGFEIRTDNKKVKNEIIEMIKKINGGLYDGTKFKWLIGQGFQESDIFGNGFQEIIPTKEKEKNGIASLLPLHPRSMDYKRDSNKKIMFENDNITPKSYVWKADAKSFTNKDTVDIPINRMVHYKTNVIGDELLGHSLIESIYLAWKRLAMIEEGSAQAIWRHGFPLHDITVGPEDDPPTPEEIQEISDEAKELSFMSEYVHDPFRKVELIESKSASKFGEYHSPFINLITAGTGIPKWLLLGTIEANRAGVQESAKFLPAIFQPLQEALSLVLEEQLFNRHLEMKGIEGGVTLHWNEILPRDIYRIGRGLSVLGGIKIDGKSVISWDEARSMLKMPGTLERSGGSMMLRVEDSRSKESLSKEKEKKESKDIFMSSDFAKRIKSGELKSIPFASYIFVDLDSHYTIKDNRQKSYCKVKFSDIISADVRKFDRLEESHGFSSEDREMMFPEEEQFIICGIESVEGI